MKKVKVWAWILLIALTLGLCACNDTTDENNCPSCGSAVDANAAFCSSCGESLKKTLSCACGHENEAEAKFCSACGTALTDNVGNGGNDGDGTLSDNQNGNQSNPAESIWLKIQWFSSSSYADQYYYDYDGVLVARRSYYRPNNKTNSIIEFSYDSHGNIILENQTYNSTGSLLSWSYDNSYDNDGRLISVIDKFSNKTEYKYDSTGQLTEVISSNKNGIVDESSVYENGKIKAVYNGEGVLFREYFYTTDGRLEKQVYYISVTNDLCTLGKYDGANNIYEETITYTYDKNGNIILENDYDPYTKNTTTYTYQYMSLAEYRAQGLHNTRPTPDGTSSIGSSSLDGSSSSSSGSSSQTKCHMCGTLGAPVGKVSCIGCDDGQVFVRFDDNGKKVTRACIVCSGTGYKKCTFCGGDGYR